MMLPLKKIIIFQKWPKISVDILGSEWSNTATYGVFATQYSNWPIPTSSARRVIQRTPTAMSSRVRDQEPGGQRAPMRTLSTTEEEKHEHTAEEAQAQ